MSILELKLKFLEKLEDEKELGQQDLRFFCLGKELSNDLFVFSYDLKDEITITCSKRPKMD
jgi:hypothetical protein